MRAPNLAVQLNPQPEFIEHRIKMYDAIKAQREAALAAKERTPIKITLRDGKELPGRAWETTPFNIAESLSKSLANNAVIAKVCFCPKTRSAGAPPPLTGVCGARHLAPTHAKRQVNGALWDLNRPFETDARLDILDFNDTEGAIAQRLGAHALAH